IWRMSLADHLHIRRQPHSRMKFGTGSILDAVNRPGPATLFETDVIGRMPVARSKHRDAVFLCSGDVSVQNRNDAVAFVNAQCAAWTKIVLQIDDEHGVTRLELWNLHTLIIACGVR